MCVCYMYNCNMCKLTEIQDLEGVQKKMSSLRGPTLKKKKNILKEQLLKSSNILKYQHLKISTLLNISRLLQQILKV